MSELLFAALFINLIPFHGRWQSIFFARTMGGLIFYIISGGINNKPVMIIARWVIVTTYSRTHAIGWRVPFVQCYASKHPSGRLHQVGILLSQPLVSFIRRLDHPAIIEAQCPHHQPITSTLTFAVVGVETERGNWAGFFSSNETKYHYPTTPSTTSALQGRCLTTCLEHYSLGVIKGIWMD